MSLFISIILFLVIAYSIVGWSLFFLQSSFVFHPVSEVPYNPSDIDLTFENVRIKTADGTYIHGWYVPARDAKYTVLFCHGNAGNVAHRLDSINILNELGLSCFIFDYRGYGKSRGKPTEKGTYLDAEGAYKWLTETRNVPAENIIIFGRSLGGSVAAYLGSKLPVASLIIESTFTSYVDMGKKFYPYMPVRLFAKFGYKTMDYIKKADMPVLIMHSRTDEIVPFEFALRLYDAAREPKDFVEIFGSHNDGFLYSGETYTNAWRDWLEFLDKQKQQAVTKPTLRKIS